VVKLAQFSTGGVAHYCIGGNNCFLEFRRANAKTGFLPVQNGFQHESLGI
jgi:hypothetical protein